MLVTAIKLQRAMLVASPVFGLLCPGFLATSSLLYVKSARVAYVLKRIGRVDGVPFDGHS